MWNYLEKKKKSVKENEEISLKHNRYLKRYSLVGLMTKSMRTMVGVLIENLTGVNRIILLQCICMI